MAVLAAANLARHRGAGNWRKMRANAADTLYQGAILIYNDAGRVNVPAGAGTETIAGVVRTTVTIAAQDDLVEVYLCNQGTEFLWVITSPAQTDEGALVYRDVSANSDNPTDLLSSADAASADVAIGRCTEFVSTALGCWVMLGDHENPTTKVSE